MIKPPRHTDAIVTEPMLKQFRLVSKVFCFLISLLPIYILVRGEILFGDHLERAPLLLVRVDESPAMFYALVAFTLAFVAAFWWLRGFLLRGFQSQIPSS